MKMSRGKRNVLFADACMCSVFKMETQWLISRKILCRPMFFTGPGSGLKEPDWDSNENDGKNMYPGYTVYKNPTVKNITSDKSETPCYVRMSVDILNSWGHR